MQEQDHAQTERGQLVDEPPGIGDRTTEHGLHYDTKPGRETGDQENKACLGQRSRAAGNFRISSTLVQNNDDHHRQQGQHTGDRVDDHGVL